MKDTMHSTDEPASELFRRLGTQKTLLASATKEDALRLSVNAHIHLPPNFSAFDNVAQALALAAEQGVNVLGASNYYDYSVYAEFAAEANRRRIFPLFGIEIIALIDDLVQAGIKLNDPGNPGRMYLCGKGIMRFDPMTEEAAGLMQTIRHKDSERMALMTRRLAEAFAAAGVETGLDAEAIRAQAATRHDCPLTTVYLQERHIAQAFQEALFAQAVPDERTAVLSRLFGSSPTSGAEDAAGVQGEIRSRLMKAGKPAYVAETFVGFDHAYSLLLALGGIPCYPVLADGATPLCVFEDPVESLIASLNSRGIHAAEFIPVRNSPEILTRYVSALRAAGLIVTAGTEHNTRDLLPLAPTCLGGVPIPEELQEIFREGACVIAAHQFLLAHGMPGYVDAQGHPNAGYADNEERIAAFHKLGAAVIQEFIRALPA